MMRRILRHLRLLTICGMILILPAVSLSGCKKVETDMTAESGDDDKEDEKAEKKKDKNSKKKKGEDDTEEVDITQETKEEDEKPKVVEGNVLTCQQNLIYNLKLSQDNGYDQEQMYQMGIYGGLINLGWPDLTDNDEVRYILYDLNLNGNDELILTYKDELVDIYAYDGNKYIHAYSNATENGDISKITIYEDGLIESNDTSADLEQGAEHTIWHALNPEIGYSFPIIEKYVYEEGESEYYTFCYDDATSAEIVKAYREYGDIPVWAYEWGDELTESEYNDLCSKASKIELPAGRKLSDVEIPEDHDAMNFPNSKIAAAKEKPVGTIELTDKVQYEANIFISNFVEQHHNGDEYYGISADSDIYDLAQFVFRYYYLNDFKQLEGPDYNELSLEKTNKVLDRFFGITLTEEEAAEFVNEEYSDREYYKDGVFRFISGDGDFMYTDTAVVYEIYEFSDGTLKMNFIAYRPDPDYDPDYDAVYHYNSKEAMNDGTMIWRARGTAYVKPFKYNGRNTYQLISMEVYSDY
ncbi:MAG: hypothetical protein K6A38_08830 [Lachnospiraceae bacterium]|nr:hypothetical protein [Lachnospiraceae bacterium]